MAHILLVEDDQWVADCYKAWLPAHNVVHATTAQMALDAADVRVPDVVILDLLLPHANGTQLLHTLRSHADWARIPVVICSSSLPVAMPDMSAYGVHAVFDKADVTPQKLRQTIAGVLRHASV